MHEGEGGLLGLALGRRANGCTPTSPPTTDNRIVRPLDRRPGQHSFGAPRRPHGLQKAGNHNGGRIEFGPDGMLYATVGDAAEAGRTGPRALNGKILRMTPDGDVPDDNPFPGSLVY